ncbi:MAG: hypothetical protein Q7K42_04050 [Candidatus Diapherotrites archaeon]|nr:hypothetical protein [Candidatus Diapherotrites archaeon]
MPKPPQRKRQSIKRNLSKKRKPSVLINRTISGLESTPEFLRVVPSVAKAGNLVESGKIFVSECHPKFVGRTPDMVLHLSKLNSDHRIGNEVIVKNQRFRVYGTVSYYYAPGKLRELVYLFKS